MTLHVKLFAAAAQAAAANHLTVACQFPVAVTSLKSMIVTQEPALTEIMPFCRVAVNHDFADESSLIHDGNEVAIIPPVSGG